VTTELRLPTARLILRPLETEDAQALWPFVSDPNLPRLMDWEAHRSLVETQNFLSATVDARKQGTDLAWAILSGDAIVGLIGLHRITHNHRAWRVDRGDLGYWIGPPYQNQGFITEAAREVLRFAFQDLGLHKLTVGCLEENAPSRRVIEKLGFRLVGEQRDHLFRFERWWNHLSYELLVSDWLRSAEVASSYPG
jgi:RimJ/RimL family protein N-acetyltransferase